MQDKRLGNYRVISCIGEGGMGAVYRVEHTLLGRAAAIKVLQPELSRNQDMVNRFFNEARATARLQHPGIVEVFDFGYCEDGAAFIVMELLQGESLTSRIARESRLPWLKACRFARQIASSLAAAHREQIVHRDLKPDNVFLIPDSEQREERTKVLDFGIAKLADAGSTALVKTHAGLIMGTPTYMSPQQCRGAGQVDHRADIYSLGCILFEMVCGRPPFVGEGVGDLFTAHMMKSPPSPRQLSELPGPLDQLILRMLAKAEADRPQSMEAVATELDAIADAYGADAGSVQPLTARLPGENGASFTPVTTLGGSTGQVTTALGGSTGQVTTTPGGSTGQVTTTLGGSTGQVSTTLGGSTGQVSTALGDNTGQVVTTFGGSTGQVSTALGGSTGQVSTAATPHRRLPYVFAGAAVVGVAGLLITVLVRDREAPAEATTTAATTAEIAPSPEMPAASPSPPRKRSPKIGLVKELRAEPADDQGSASASAGRARGAAITSGASTTAQAGSARSTSELAMTARAGSAGSASEIATATRAESGSSAVPAGTADTASTPANAFAFLLSVAKSLPWFDQAATDNWLVSSMGPEVALTVTSSPSGAEVALDGRILGKTPLSLSVDRGGYDFTLVLTLAHHAERTVTMSAVLDRTEHVVLPPLVTHKVTSKPPGAELVSNGDVIGTTPAELELPQSNEPEPLTLRLAGYLEQTIEIVPSKAGTTAVVLEREPQPVVHELTCDLECEVVLDGDVVGKAGPESAYRDEFLEVKGQWRTYVLRPIGNQRRQTSFRAPADKSVKTMIRLPCAPQTRTSASRKPRVYDPYDPCRER